MTTYWVEISLGIDWLDSDLITPGTCEQTNLSESQYTRARNVQKEDVLLHHILGIRCWAGYSHVKDPPTRISNPQTESDKAFPYSMSISRGTWLKSPAEFILTRSIAGLSHDNWHRKGYVRVDSADAELIIKAVDYASEKIGVTDDAFIEKLKVLRDANASERCKRNADYRCTLCATSESSWRERLFFEDSTLLNSDTNPGWFVHAHHIKPVAANGNADIDNNLLCVCPNCHRVVQRLGEDRLRELLRERGIK